MGTDRVEDAKRHFLEHPASGDVTLDTSASTNAANGHDDIGVAYPDENAGERPVGRPGRVTVIPDSEET